MRDSFPGWVPPDREVLERYWREAIFAVDTSVLLDLYRFSADAREGLLEALKSFGDRLWIPHQVALEFHRNRYGVLLAQREAEGKLLDEVNGIQRELDDRLSKLLRGAGRRDMEPLREAIEAGFSELSRSLREAEKAHTEGLGKSIQEDPIYDEVENLCAGRMGEPFSAEEMTTVIEDAKQRLSAERPPGFLDGGKSGDAAYGDVILWHQLCAAARTRSAPVVLVTDDRKADWVWEMRGKTLGPRPELVAEMLEKTGLGFYLYTPSRLFELWKDREDKGADGKSEILEEMRSSSSPEPVLAREDWKPVFGQDGPWRHLASDRSLRAPDGSLRIVEPARRLVASATSSLEFVDGKCVLSLQLVPNEIDGVTPGVRARVSDDRGQSSTAELRMGLVAAGTTHTVSFDYPFSFIGATEIAAGQYAVEWTAFVHGPPSGAASGEITEALARNSFSVLPRPEDGENPSGR